MKIHRNSFIEYKFLQWITEQIRLPYRFNSSSAVIKSRHVRVPIFANPHSHSRPPNLSLPNRSITSVRNGINNRGWCPVEGCPYTVQKSGATSCRDRFLAHYFSSHFYSSLDQHPNIRKFRFPTPVEFSQQPGRSPSNLTRCFESLTRRICVQPPPFILYQEILETDSRGHRNNFVIVIERRLVKNGSTSWRKGWWKKGVKGLIKVTLTSVPPALIPLIRGVLVRCIICGEASILVDRHVVWKWESFRG